MYTKEELVQLQKQNVRFEEECLRVCNILSRYNNYYADFDEFVLEHDNSITCYCSGYGTTDHASFDSIYLTMSDEELMEKVVTPKLEEIRKKIFEREEEYRKQRRKLYEQLKMEFDLNMIINNEDS